MMGMRIQGHEVFVVVSYDFEYHTEEGKEVWMKEGEILLLLTKTNNDWWQVIRRGDRRPFYAPARYVVELRPEEGDWDSGETVHYRCDNGEPLPSSIAFGVAKGTDKNGAGEKSGYFSTFLGNGNKRSSYSPATSLQPNMAGPQSSDFGVLFGAPRFHERYRSNSMDSILVADISRHVYGKREDNRGPNFRHIGPIPVAVPHALEKRPTFDNIDKRASWSLDKSGSTMSLTAHRTADMYRPPDMSVATHRPPELIGHRPPDRNYSIYSNSRGPFPQTQKRVEVGSSPKKPIPLPRSKIPVPNSNRGGSPGSGANGSGSSAPPTQQFRTFKRSKTDLSLDALSAYKAGRAVQGVVPGRVVQGQTMPANRGANLRKQSTNRQFMNKDVLRPTVIAEEHSENRDTNSKQKQGSAVKEKTSEKFFTRLKGNKDKTNSFINNKDRDKKSKSVLQELNKESSKISPQGKPALKEKPVLAGIKSSDKNNVHKPNQIVRVQSESDLIIKLEEENSKKLKTTENEMKISVKVQGGKKDYKDNINKNINGAKKTKENLSDPRTKTKNLNEKSIPKVLNASDAVISDNVKMQSNVSIDNEPLPTPPPTPSPPLASTPSSPIVIPATPLKITTEPMSVSTNSGGFRTSVDDKSNCSTSFDSLDASLEEEGWSQEWSSPPLVQSPAGSTCSKAPPSPLLGQKPSRKVSTDWGEYIDSSGRKFYFNTQTREKSWKPPRRARGSSEGCSSPTSPGPFFDLDSGESAFESSQNVEDGSKLLSSEEPVDVSIPVETELKSSGASDVVDSKTEEQVDEENNSNEEKEDPKLDDLESTSSQIPSGYEVRQDEGETSGKYYVNMFTGVSWYTATDEAGKTYYYEENGNESCWSLPNVSRTIQDHSANPSPVPPKEKEETPRRSYDLTPSSSNMSLSATSSANKVAEAAETTSKTESLRRKFYFPPVSSPNFQIGNVNIVVLKQGPLHKTKLVEHGKKYRKNWCTSHLVLTDTFLLFFKEAKVFAAMQSGTSNSKPDHCVDLKGGQIEWCNSDKSKRSNVFELATVLDLRLLLQDDDFTVANDWFCDIEHVIVSLSQRELVAQGAASLTQDDRMRLRSGTSTLQSNKGKVGRSKSFGKMKFLASNEDVNAGSTVTIANANPKERSNIREKLRKFFLRRPAMEDLMKRGIMKNEPVFGSTLSLLSRVEHGDVPMFVRKCVQIIESKPEYLTTDGVYRQSGNLSVIQKIRLQVDQGNIAILDTVDDVHVLTGALKLFFRELKEPLIPWNCVESLISATQNPGRGAKIRALREVITRLQEPHRATLFALLIHLDKVTSFRDVNRMQIANLAIVFGPTLMWPPASMVTTNMALNMMQQNMIVEALLTNLSNLR